MFHWRTDEGQALAEELTRAGYEVDYPGDQQNGSFAAFRRGGYHAAVIDLTRLPSHGRYVALEIRARKSTRHIPIVFVDGDKEKLERIRKELPDAVYTSRAKFAGALKKAKPLANPVATTAMMDSYTARSTAQKMGIKAGSRIAVIAAPPGYAKAIGPIPEGAAFEEDPAEILPITLWFVHDPDEYLSSLPKMRRLAAAKSRLWVLWPKAASKKGAQSGVTQTLIREAALEIGLVDYKICSVDETWSAIVFTVKK